MGGCTIGGFVEGHTAILTPVGSLELTDPGVLAIDALCRDRFIDKGNADTLSKLLVCLQVI